VLIWADGVSFGLPYGSQVDELPQVPLQQSPVASQEAPSVAHSTPAQRRTVSLARAQLPPQQSSGTAHALPSGKQPTQSAPLQE